MRAWLGGPRFWFPRRIENDAGCGVVKRGLMRTRPPKRIVNFPPPLDCDVADSRIERAVTALV